MELETSSNMQSPAVIAKQKPLILHPVLLVVLVIALLSLAGIGFLYQKNVNLQSDYDKQSALIADLSKKIDAYKADSDRLTNLESRTDAIAVGSYLSVVEHEIEGGVVTDDFVVEKTYFNVLDSGKLSVTIDVDTQPQMSLHYTGQGAFDLADRELRAKSMSIIDAVKERYTADAPDQLPKWDDSTSVSLTIKNYAIGDSISGEFKLVGEK